MAELFRQMAFINAILGGFAITFLSVLLSLSSKQKVINWVISFLVASSSCFVISALGATFSAVVATRSTNLPQNIEFLHIPMSLLFLAGVVLLFISMGMSGWIRSRRLGIATMVISFLATIGALLMLAPFITYT